MGMKIFEKKLSSKVDDANNPSEDGCKKCETCKCKTPEELDLQTKEAKVNIEGVAPVTKPNMGIRPAKKD